MPNSTWYYSAAYRMCAVCTVVGRNWKCVLPRNSECIICSMNFWLHISAINTCNILFVNTCAKWKSPSPLEFHYKQDLLHRTEYFIPQCRPEDLTRFTLIKREKESPLCNEKLRFFFCSVASFLLTFYSYLLGTYKVLHFIDSGDTPKPNQSFLLCWSLTNAVPYHLWSATTTNTAPGNRFMSQPVRV
jgi:hypothetical protein